MQCAITVRLYSGAREIFSQPPEWLLTVRDGHGKERFRGFVKGPQVTVRDLPFSNNFGDICSVLAWAKGFEQTGFLPVRISPKQPASVDLMLVRQNADFDFQRLRGESLRHTHPKVAALLAPRERLLELAESRPAALACFLNLAEAMSQIPLGGIPALDYVAEVMDAQMQPDRFYGWARKPVVEALEEAAAQGAFERIPNPAAFHPGATRSFKQIQFAEANVQLTLHEKETCRIGGQECVKLEADIDYYRDLGAHALLEVIPNALSGSRTDPRRVYVMRWTAARNTGAPEFAPPYALL